MASNALIFKCGGSSSSGGIGALEPIPDLGGTLYAGYIFGSRVNSSPARDISGNGRDLTLYGEAPGTQYVTGSPSAYAICPFTDTDFMSGGSGTIVIVAKVGSGAGGALAGTFESSATASIALTARSDMAVRAYVNGPRTDTSDLEATSRDVTKDINRGHKFDMYAGIYTLSTIRSYFLVGGSGTSTAPQSSLPHLLSSMGGGKNIWIANIPAENLTALSRVAIALFYNTELTKTDLDSTIYPALQTNMSRLGEVL